MPPEAKKLLFDIRESATAILDFAASRSRKDYAQVRWLHGAINWEFTIIGEALNRLGRDHPDIAARLSDTGIIIAFRNRIVHGYDTIRPRIVWDIIQDELPVLRQEVDELLNEPESGA